jgi:hypothetical protein
MNPIRECRSLMNRADSVLMLSVIPALLFTLLFPERVKRNGFLSSCRAPVGIEEVLQLNLERVVSVVLANVGNLSYALVPRLAHTALTWQQLRAPQRLVPNS